MDLTKYGRFKCGKDVPLPPEKIGDYAFLLHVIKSLNSTGKGAIILPHGVLFRGNAEGDIRTWIIKQGYIKAIIGLPANLFFGTGIPACIIVLDKENASQRKSMASGDYIDLKKYEHDMRYLIETYIDAKDSEQIIEIDDFSLLKYIISQKIDVDDQGEKKKINPGVASTIENNVRKKIIEKRTTNPIYYEKMSSLLKMLVEARKNATLSYKELLDKYEDLVKNVENPENNEEYPESIRNSSALRAFYDLYDKNESKAIQIYRTVKASKQADFRTSDIKKRKIVRALSQNLGLTKDEIKNIMKLVVEQEEF